MIKPLREQLVELLQSEIGIKHCDECVHVKFCECKSKQLQ